MLRIGPGGELVSIRLEPESGGKYVCTCYKPQMRSSQCTLHLDPSHCILDTRVIENHVLVVLSQNSKDKKVFLIRCSQETGNALSEPLLIHEHLGNTEQVSGRIYYRSQAETVDVGLFGPTCGLITLFRVKDNSILEVQGHTSLSISTYVGWLTSAQDGLIFAWSDPDFCNENKSMIRCTAIEVEDDRVGRDRLDYWFSRMDNVCRMEFSEGGRAALVLFNNGVIQVLTQSPSHRLLNDKAYTAAPTNELELSLPQNVGVDEITKLELAWTCSNGYRPVILTKNGTCLAVSSNSQTFVPFAQDVLDIQCHDVFNVGSFTQFHVLHRDGSIQVFDENMRLLCHLKSNEDVLSLPDAKPEESIGLKSAKEAILKRIARIEQEKAHEKRVKRDQLTVIESLERFAAGNASLRFEFPHEHVSLVNEKTGMPYVPTVQQTNNNSEDDDSKPKCDLLNCWFHGPSSLVVVECKFTCVGEDNKKDKPAAVHLSLAKGKTHRGNFIRRLDNNNENHFIAWAELVPSTTTTRNHLQLVILAELVRGRNLAISSHVVHVLDIPIQCVLASQWVNVLKQGEESSPPSGYVVDHKVTRVVSKCDWKNIETSNVSAFANVQRTGEGSMDTDFERVSISTLGNTRLAAMLQVLASNCHEGVHKCFDEDIDLVEMVKMALKKEMDAGENCRIAQTVATDDLVSQLLVRLHKDAESNI